jgi:hypothetical protein
LGVHGVTTTVTAMIKIVVKTPNTMTVITMTANTVDREGLQMKRVKLQQREIKTSGKPGQPEKPANLNSRVQDVSA